MEFENTNQNPSVAPSPAPKKHDAVAKSYAFGACIALAVTLSFVAGVFVGDMRRGPTQTATVEGSGKVLNKNTLPPAGTRDVDMQAFWDIWKTVKARHVGTDLPSDSKMFYGAVAGMVGSFGDPYTVFFDPEYAQKFAKDLAGEFEGIGAEIGIKQDRLTVVAPLPNTPAAKAGLRAGDRILAIDGIDTTGMLVDDAVSRIRGAHDTKVKLMVMREGFKNPKDFEITRAKITVESVTMKMETVDGKKFARITIAHFNDKTVPLFTKAVNDLLQQGADGVVLDLRNNPGGYLDAAVDVAGNWIQQDVVVTEKFGDGTAKPYNSTGTARLADMPTVVLINGGSASASEIVAGALQDTGKAKLVGEKSFGKGSVQDYNEFADGSALKMTIALWYTPKDHNINKQGIAPDVEVKTTSEDFNADKDPQLDRAHDVLTGKKLPSTTAEAPAAAPDSAKAKSDVKKQ